MIVDARELPEGCELQGDVAVVGGGPAGITLALELAEAGLAVLLLEGGRRQDRHRLDPFQGEVTDNTRHPPLTLYRTSGLGGTSSLWGGRCVPFDAVDFEPRSHVKWSGWPIGRAEMDGWYARASAWCESGQPRFRAADALGDDAPPAIHGFGDSEIDTDGIERFSRPTDFGRRYGKRLATGRHVTVVLGARCNGMTMAPSRRGVAGLRFAGAPGHSFRVRADCYVLAMGGLEIPRLMLAEGVGSPALGRFYMCHLEGKAAVARFRADTPVVFSYERDGDGIYLRRHFALTPEAQRRRGLTNVILRIEPPAIADPAHASPVLSALWLSRTFLKAEYARKLASFGYRGDLPVESTALVARHIRNVAIGLPQLGRFAAVWLVRHSWARRKLPYVAIASRDGSFSLDYNAEQSPNPDSRITLGEERDQLGMPRLKVNWQVRPEDVESVVETHRVLAAALARSGAGVLEVQEDAIRQGYNAIGGHHIGTARMAHDRSLGVVDSDCKVFGVDNLWLAGSAVFPTCSHANPTLTIVALAARLANHLVVRLRQRDMDPGALAQAAE